MKTFNPPGTWMDRVDPCLLERLWVKKGCPGKLLRCKWGVDIISVNTPFGVMSSAYDSNISERLAGLYKKEITS